MVQRFKETSRPVFTSASALSRGILRTLKGKETIHFNADASNTELLFRIIHSMNQLKINGAVSNWCEQFGFTEDEMGQERTLGKREPVNKGTLKCVNSQEVNLFVSSPRLASGNNLREKTFRTSKSLSETIQFTKVCEDASFWYPVSAGMSYKTKPDEDDGFGQTVPLCREYTLSRVKPTIQSICSNYWRNKSLDQPIEVHIMKILDISELKSQFHLQTIQDGHLMY